MEMAKTRMPTNAEEVGSILKIVHLLGGRASFADIADPEQHVETRHEPKYSADLIRRALDACTSEESGELTIGSDNFQYLRLLDRQDPERGRGRPRVPYVWRYEAAHIIAITAQRRFYDAYLADLTGSPLIGTSVIEREWSKGEPTRDDLHAVIQELLAVHQKMDDTRHRPLLAIALTAPGPIDTQRGIVQARQMGELGGVSIVEELTERFELKTLIHEDSQAFALAEMYAGRRELSLIVITLGEGFGYAIGHEGKLLEGASNLWQSSSHFVLPNVEPSLVCSDCHRAGCIRAYLGEKGRQALQEVYPAWKGKGSIYAQQLAESLFAHVVAIQTITLDPMHVALDIGAQYLEPFGDDVPIYNSGTLIQNIRDLATVPGRPLPTIEMSRLQPSPRARGAGILALHHLFQHPDAGYWRSLTRNFTRPIPF